MYSWNMTPEIKPVEAERKSPKKRDSNQITLMGKPGEVRAVTTARTVLNPTVQAAVTLKEYGKAYGDLDLGGLVDSLSEQTRASSNGDRQRAEAMLTAQAHTLDAIFNTLAQLAICAERTDHFDRYFKFALRAQSQCRSTWETLVTVRHPPAISYVQQANIAHGPQQVNNAAAVPHSTPRAGGNSISRNELLENKDGERLDPGAACAPSQSDSEMATVGEIDRA